jgi:hypothetical protein
LTHIDSKYRRYYDQKMPGDYLMPKDGKEPRPPKSTIPTKALKRLNIMNEHITTPVTGNKTTKYATDQIQPVMRQVITNFHKKPMNE